MDKLYEQASNVVKDIESPKAKFLALSMNFVHRVGNERLLEWLDKTDFYEAPASTRFHGAHKGGLVEHSLNVAFHLFKLFDAYADSFSLKDGDATETLAIVSLYHDLCKANFYSVGTRNQKNEKTGQWEKVPFYTIDDNLPYGHGEKSVYLIEHFMRLKTAEAIAIRWHMGAFDSTQNMNTMSQAFDEYPISLFLHTADMFASHLDEKE